MSGFGLVAPRIEGTMIDPETGGSAATPEREAELRVMYSTARAKEEELLARADDFSSHKAARLMIYSMGDGYYNVVCEADGDSADVVQTVFNMLDDALTVRVRAQPEVLVEGSQSRGRFRVIMRA